MDKEKMIEIPESEMGMSGYSKFSWKLWEAKICNMSEAQRADQIMREQGYRKDSEIAKEIFEKLYANIKFDGHTVGVWKNDLIEAAKEYGISLE